MRVLLKGQAAATWFVIIATAVARITGWLSLVLPLKVVLLAASDGVPRYFRFFIDPADKAFWIVALTVATILLFIITLILDAISARVAKTASGDIVGRATSLALMQDQENVAQIHYERLCRVAAYGLFGFAALTILYIVNQALAGFLLATMIATYGYAAWVLSSSNDINPSRAKSFITDKLSSFLSIASSIAFLGGFLVLVIPFALGHGGNLLFAIAAILLSRQMLGTTTDAVQAAAALDKKRLRINALVFRDHQLEETEKRHQLTFRKLFDKPTRQRTAQKRLRVDEGEMDACWEDATKGPVKFLVLHYLDSDSNTGPARYQQQIYPPAYAYRLDNEALLFEHVSRERLWAPRVIDRFSEGAFTCQICDYGSGMRIGRQWKQWEPEILQHLWSVALPDALIEAFRAGDRSLGDRFNGRLIENLELGVDSPDEEQTYASLTAHLSEIRTRLKGLPHYIYNPEINGETAVFSRTPGAVLLLVWGRWSIEPLGISLPKGCRDEDLARWLKNAQKHRPELAEVRNTDNLRLASKCHTIERLAKKMRFKAALEEARSVVRLLDGRMREGGDTTSASSG